MNSKTVLIIGMTVLWGILSSCSLDSEGSLTFGPVGFGNPNLYGNRELSGRKIPAVTFQDRADAISKHLTGRKLEPIEGVWIWSDNHYEVVIFRNSLPEFPGYDYLGFVTDTAQEGWHRGEAKLLLKETASSGIFIGFYVTANRSYLGTTFMLTNQNLIETSMPTGPYGHQEKLHLIRMYPKDVPSGSNVSSKSSRGTAFFVAPDLLATNYHVVHEASLITVHVKDAPRKAELLLKDQRNDLALLKLAAGTEGSPIESLNSGHPCLQLGNSDQIRGGEHVYTLGYPLSGLLGNSISAGDGIVNNTSGIDGDPRVFQISVPIQPGHSGSPMFDQQGQVVGVVTSTLGNEFLFAHYGTLPQNVNFAIKSSYLKSLVALVPKNECPVAIGGKAGPFTAREVQERFAPAVVRIEATH